MPPRSPLVVLAASWVHFASNVLLLRCLVRSTRPDIQRCNGCPIVFRYTTKHPEYKSLMGFVGISPTRRDHLLEPVVDLLRGHTIEVVADGHESNADQNFQQLVLLVPCIKENLDQFARNTSALRN